MPTYIIRQIPVGPMMNFAYLIGSNGVSQCGAVDPGWEAEKIMEEAGKKNWRIEKILLTHTHFDHAGAAVELAGLTHATVYVHKEELAQLPKGFAVLPTDEGTTIDIGGTQIKCLHTPGHSPGSQCFLAGDILITGDTLFVEGCGRVDLPGSDPKKMLASLKRLSKLTPSIRIYPGHNYGSSPDSTIGEQVISNPYMTAGSEAVLL